MAETKPKPADSLRTPKPKKKLGLAVPPALRLPHEDLIPSPQKESTGQATMPSQTSLTRHSSSDINPKTLTLPSQTSTSSLTRQGGATFQPAPIAPVRDFTKVANSIHREAVPGGLFSGKGKQLYDCLYSLSRGAVVPSRSVRISRPRLMKLAGIGARVTFEANVERLVSVGLIQVRRIAGEHDGNEYTVLLPEELSMPSTTSMTSQTSETSHAQNLDRLVSLETSQTSHSSSLLESMVSGESKTSFKTKDLNTDDEAFAGFAAAVRKTAKEITGRESSKAEAARWTEVAEVLMTELRIAAGRTTVSSVPAFLAEHLRRRLWKKDKRQIETEAVEQQERTGSAPKLDASKCPDCFGTGMYYPEGFEKGVARCPHLKLTAEISE